MGGCVSCAVWVLPIFFSWSYGSFRFDSPTFIKCSFREVDLPTNVENFLFLVFWSLLSNTDFYLK